MAVGIVANAPSTGSVSLTVSGSNFGTQVISTLPLCTCTFWHWQTRPGANNVPCCCRTTRISRGTATQVLRQRTGSPTARRHIVWLLASARRGRLPSRSLGSGTHAQVRKRARCLRASSAMIETDVAQQTFTEALSFDRPSLSTMHPQNSAATGSLSITVSGQGFGQFASTASFRIGSTANENTEWDSDTSVQSLVAHGIRGTRRASMTVLIGDGSVSEIFSYNPAGLSVQRRSNRAAT
eukprot:2081954-Rhodomonas_salina.1